MPVALEHVDKKEFNAAVADTHGGGGPFINVFTVQEIVFQFLFIDLIRCFVVKIDELAYGAGIALLCTFAHSGELQGSHGFLKIVFHHNSPFLVKD